MIGILSLVSYLVIVVGAIPAQAQLVGYEFSDSNSEPCDYNPDFFCAPEATGYVWKAFRSQAKQTGFVNQFIIYIASAPKTKARVGWGIYADKDGQVGALKAGGYYRKYTFNPGINVFPATIIKKNRIVMGKNYWLTFHSSLGDLVKIERGRVNFCPNDEKRGTNIDGPNAWRSFSPPPGRLFMNRYNPNCYAWGVEETDDTLNTVLDFILP